MATVTVDTLLPEHVFPQGKYITFDEIEKGDTIVRGGTTIYGEPMEYGFLISRAFDKATEEYFTQTEDGESVPHQVEVWNSEDPQLGSPAAYRFVNDGFPQPYYYRLPLDEFKQVELVGVEWTKKVLNLISLQMEEKAFNDLTENTIVVDVWLEDREDNTRGEWIDQIAIGYTGNHIEEFGWELKNVNGYLLAVEDATNKTILTLIR